MGRLGQVEQTQRKDLSAQNQWRQRRDHAGAGAQIPQPASRSDVTRASHRREWRAASGAVGGGWPPAGPHGPGAPGQPPRVGERTAEQELDLDVGKCSGMTPLGSAGMPGWTW
jgi:hypothetical protein